MSEEPTPAATEPTASCCSTSTSSCPCLTWLPFVLLAAAAVLYFHDIRTSRTRAQAAGDVRARAMYPVQQLAITHKLEGRDIPFQLTCPPFVTTNLLSAMAGAEATRFPRGKVEGDEFELLLLHTNASLSVLRAVRLQSDPDTLFVGVKTPTAFDAKGNPTEWKLYPPARVKNAGALINDMLIGLRLAAERMPPESEFIAAATNDEARAALERKMAPQNSTNPAPSVVPVPSPATE